MISRWKDVARKTAEQLGLSEEVVIAHIEMLAAKTQAKVAHPDVMECELLGIGALAANYPRLKEAIGKHNSRIRFQQRMLERHKQGSNPPGIKKYTDSIKILEADVDKFYELLEIKLQFAKHGKKRTDFEREHIEENGRVHDNRSKAHRQAIEEKRKAKLEAQSAGTSTRDGSGHHEPDEPDFVSRVESDSLGF